MKMMKKKINEKGRREEYCNGNGLRERERERESNSLFITCL
jgi:hypothetical protein